MGNHVLTDSKNRALCLNYRNGKRCRRLAKVEAYWSDSRIGRGQQMHMAMCEECAEARQAEIVQRNAKGFTVSAPQFGPVYREYIPIGRAEQGWKELEAMGDAYLELQESRPPDLGA
jgi:hypothetical protein